MRRFRRPAGWLHVAVIGVWLSACTQAAPEPAAPSEAAARSGPPPKVVVIGIDGATWAVLRPLIRQGQLPAFQQLLERGSGGVLRSIPPMISPAVWTTIATGYRRQAHGITGFEVGDRLVNAGDRMKAPVWTIAGRHGLRHGTVGWWATWPATAVNGWQVSDRAADSRWQAWSGAAAESGHVAPAQLWPQLQGLRVAPEALTRAAVERIAKLTDAEWQELVAAEKPVFAHGLSVLKFAFAAQRSYEEMTIHLLDRQGQPDLLSLFLIATDPISHTFWHLYDPSRFKGVRAERAGRLGDVIPAIYRHNDRLLARLLRRLDPNTVVVVVSDHGFQASGTIPRPVSRSEFAELKAAANPKDTVAIGQSGKHHRDGVIILSGPGVVRGAQLRASILDVAPTVLKLLGIAPDPAMPGQVIHGALSPAMRHSRDLRQPLPDQSEAARSAREAPQVLRRPASDEHMRDRLRSLGYVQ